MRCGPKPHKDVVRSTVDNDELGDLRVGEFQAELGLGTLRFEVGR